MRTYDDLTGRTFGKWYVDKFVSNVKDIHYNCICKCGKEKIIAGSSLRTGKTTQCRQCAGKDKSLKGTVPKAIFNRFLDSATKRNIEFNLSIEYVSALFIAQSNKCALSGLEISFADSCYGHSHGESTASLDRIDSRYGYIEGNVQWVHKNVNKMKQNLEQSYFISLCKKIVESNIDIQTLTIPVIEKRTLITKNSRNKLSQFQVEEIRNLHLSGMKNKDIAKKYNCSTANISYIITNQSRKS